MTPRDYQPYAPRIRLWARGECPRCGYAAEVAWGNEQLVTPASRTEWRHGAEVSVLRIVALGPFDVLAESQHPCKP